MSRGDDIFGEGERIGPSRIRTQWATPVPPKVGWMRQFRYFIKMYESVKNVEGDVVECGLGEGNTFLMLAYLAGSEDGGYRHTRILWGFDSFQGWPEPSEYDQSPRNPQKGEWRVSPDMILERLDASSIPQEFPDLEIRIVPGFFAETLPNFPDRKIAFLHIDCDLYAGYRDVLARLFPKVARGGVVLFDEYKEFPPLPEYGGGRIEKWPGATKAIDKYFVDSPYAIQSYPINHWPGSKKYFVVKS